tara:strand:- start:4542 stop:4958 length:417 start_codon:yes stop_codon:yes gene_type:complete
MPKINSRNKGAQFERDIAKILNEFFIEEGIDYQTKRNLDQYQQKDLCDLNIPYHAIECKFYREGDLLRPAWWEQVCKASSGKIPTLIYKFNRRPVRVCIPLSAINLEWSTDHTKVAVLSMDDWLSVLATNWDLYSKES